MTTAVEDCGDGGSSWIISGCLERPSGPPYPPIAVFGEQLCSHNPGSFDLTASGSGSALACIVSCEAGWSLIPSNRFNLPQVESNRDAETPQRGSRGTGETFFLLNSFPDSFTILLERFIFRWHLSVSVCTAAVRLTASGFTYLGVGTPTRGHRINLTSHEVINRNRKAEQGFWRLSFL